MGGRFNLYKRAFRKAAKGKSFADEFGLVISPQIIRRYLWVAVCFAVCIMAIYYINVWAILLFIPLYFIGGLILWKIKWI